jgi:hypothetical protein
VEQVVTRSSCCGDGAICHLGEVNRSPYLSGQYVPDVADLPFVGLKRLRPSMGFAVEEVCCLLKFGPTDHDQ